MNRRALFPLLTLPFLTPDRLPQAALLPVDPLGPDGQPIPQGPYLSLGMVSTKYGPDIGDIFPTLKGHDGYYLAKVEQGPPKLHFWHDGKGQVYDYWAPEIIRHWVVPVREEAGEFVVALTSHQDGMLLDQPEIPDFSLFVDQTPEGLHDLVRQEGIDMGWL